MRTILALIAVVATLGLSGCGYNDIQRTDEATKAAWAEVLNQYKRRSDLVPNLVETVKGFADQERKVLIDVTEARTRATSVQIPPDILTNPEAMKRFQDAQNSLGGALRQLLVVVERYPEVKSGQNFLALQSQLEGTENRIAVARRDYINSVRAYNTELVTFPGRIWKWLLYGSAKEMASFDIPAEGLTASEGEWAIMIHNGNAVDVEPPVLRRRHAGTQVIVVRVAGAHQERPGPGQVVLDDPPARHRPPAYGLAAAGGVLRYFAYHARYRSSRSFW